MLRAHGSEHRSDSRWIFRMFFGSRLASSDRGYQPVLASQTELKTFAPRERIYKIGDPAPQAYVLLSGKISTVDDVIEEKTTIGERIADWVARFGGSWSFVILFSITLTVYTIINIALNKDGVGPHIHLFCSFLSMLAARSGSGNHDDSEPPGRRTGA